MLLCIIILSAVSVGSAGTAYLPKDPPSWFNPPPIHDEIWAVQRAAHPTSPSATTVKDLIRETLKKAGTEGIKGIDLEKAVKKLSTDVEVILSMEKANLDLGQIQSDLDTVKPDIMSLGSLNADLALLDGLAYLLQHVTVPDNIHITLAAVKMVSDHILTEIPSPEQVVTYIHVPYHRPASLD